jgi:hypothetical protein
MPSKYTLYLYMKPFLSKAEWRRYFVHLRILNLNHLTVIEVPFNVINRVPNFIKIHHFIQKLLGGRQRSDKQTFIFGN